MAQLNKGQTFTDGEQVTGVRLNQLVDSSTLVTGAISEQAAMTAGTVALDDRVLLLDVSANSGAGALTKPTAGDVLGSNLPVVTSALSSPSDITITTTNGTAVTAVPYSSLNGILVTVGVLTPTPTTAHGLTTGQVITVSSADNAQYTGTFRVTVINSNQFTYSLSTTATVGSGVLTYAKQGAVRNNKNEVIGGNLYVDGTAAIAGATAISGNTTIGGNLTVTGILSQSGGGTQTGNITQTGTVTQSGTVNVTGTMNVTGDIQYNGVPVYGMYELSQYVKIGGGSAGTITFNEIFSKTNNEIWLIQLTWSGSTQYTDDSQVIGGYRITLNNINYDNTSGFLTTWIIPKTTVFTSSLKFSLINPAATWGINSSNVIITKYITA